MATVAASGARIGSQTSYQSSFAWRDLGTPRGGRRTVPMRSPSPGALGVPRRTIRTAILPANREDEHDGDHQQHERQEEARVGAKRGDVGVDGPDVRSQALDLLL